jgi:hypothetical protein
MEVRHVKASRSLNKESQLLAWAPLRTARFPPINP